MNVKNLSILAIFTLAIVITAILLTQKETIPTTAEKLFPDLENVINDVTEININTQEKSTTLIRTGENWQWQIKEKHLYPASLDKVHKLLLGVINLTVIEAKTSNPSRYAKIGVEDISEEGAKSVLLTLKKADGEIKVNLIIGNDRIAKSDSTRREIYVRKQGEKQSWLTLGQLSSEKTPKDWLDQQIVNIDSNNIRQVSITHPEGDSLLLFKDSPEDENYQLAELPENAKIKLPYMLDNIATTLSGLDLDDVTVATEVEFNDDATNRAVFTTFDGLEITMTTTEKEGKHYAKFAAAFNQAVKALKKDEKATASEEAETQPASSEEAEIQPITDEEIKKQVDKLNAKFKGWAYELSKYKVDYLAKKSEELIGVEEPADAPIEEIKQPSAFGNPTT
jgi:hypothetical protein